MHSQCSTLSWGSAVLYHLFAWSTCANCFDQSESGHSGLSNIYLLSCFLAQLQLKDVLKRKFFLNKLYSERKSYGHFMQCILILCDNVMCTLLRLILIMLY